MGGKQNEKRLMRVQKHEETVFQESSLWEKNVDTKKEIGHRRLLGIWFSRAGALWSRL